MKSITHKISIPSILRVESNAIASIGTILSQESVKDVIIITDNNIYEMISDKIEPALLENKINFSYVFIQDNTDINQLISQAYTIKSDVEFLIGVGGGSIIDRTKYISYITKIPCFSIPTSPSNDGILSPFSSLYINSKRTSVPAKMPYGLVVDLDIIKDAPIHMIYSGIGDSVSNLTAIEDMKYENTILNTNVDDFSKLISLRSVESLLHFQDVNIRSYEFISALVKSLTMSGIAMEVAGSSSPSSGSEHLISHALDQLLESNNYPHGIQVGISTYIISIIQNNKSIEIDSFFSKTGFWDFVKTLEIQQVDLIRAIDLAPTIKPHRKTILHDKSKRDMAKRIVCEDSMLQLILK